MVARVPATIYGLASLPPETRAAILAELSPAECEALLRDWRFLARPEQLPPEGTWRTWAYIAGRGAGKTRTGAEWIRDQVRQGVTQLGMVAPTAADVRDIMVEGPSGLLAVCYAGDVRTDGTAMGMAVYEPSKRRVVWPACGAVAHTYSADEPNRLRGPNHEKVWADELAAWRFLRESWDNLEFGLRIGTNPQVFISTTPKPVSVLREILKDPKTVKTTGSTYSNQANLAPSFLEHVLTKYRGTRTGRQELHGELLEEAEGALWTRAMIEAAQRMRVLEEPLRIVVAVDPAATSKDTSDETGIVAAARMEGWPPRGRVLADASGRMSPAKWGRRAVDLYHALGADRIVAEANNGGEMVQHVIQTVDRSVPVKLVHASKGKKARAEPVSALYEQGRISHAGSFPDLEDQLVTWEPLSGMDSPDRLDALVWALTDLLVQSKRPSVTVV